MIKLIALVCALGPSLAWSQSGPPPAPSAPARQTELAPNAPAVQNAQGSFELTLEQLRDRLKLAPEQLPLWTNYANKVSAYIEVFYREKPVLASQQNTAPQQVARIVDTLQNRLAAMEEVESATKKLYAALNAEQQKTANQTLLSTIPSFGSGAAGPASEDARKKGAKPEGRGHRGGSAGGGGMGGPG